MDKLPLLFAIFSLSALTACQPEQTNTVDSEGTSEKQIQEEPKVYKIYASVNGKKGHISITAEELKTIFEVKVTDNLGNQLEGYEVVSFDLTTAIRDEEDGNSYETTRSSSNAEITEDQKKLIANTKTGQKFWFENVKVKEVNSDEMIDAGPVSIKIAE
jgi:hypothetical protein